MTEEFHLIGDWRIPARFAGGLARYVLHRIPTGSFLRAVLENDLTEAVGRGDEEALACLVDLTRIVYNYVPMVARRGGVDDWLAGRDDPKNELEDAAIKQRYGEYWKDWVNA